MAGKTKMQELQDLMDNVDEAAFKVQEESQAEKPNAEEVYPLITLGRFLTAHEARQMYKPTYTLEEILEHIEGRATESQKITGYEFERMPESVMRKLEELGYKICSDGIGTVEINWE